MENSTICFGLPACAPALEQGVCVHQGGKCNLAASFTVGNQQLCSKPAAKKDSPKANSAAALGWQWQHTPSLQLPQLWVPIWTDHTEGAESTQCLQVHLASGLSAEALAGVPPGLQVEKWTRRGQLPPRTQLKATYQKPKSDIRKAAPVLVLNV